MTLQQIYTLLSQINEKYNQIQNNAKTIEEFDEQMTFLASAYIPISSGGITKKLNIQTILAAVVQTYIDRLIYVDEITIIDNDVTIPAGVQALINNLTYFTVTDSTFTIPFADTGKSRIDIVVMNNTSTLSVITGIETLGVAVRPNIPLNSVLVTQINVTDSAFTTVDGLLYIGEFDSFEELNTSHPSALSGSYAVVSDLSSSSVYYWSAINGWFTNAGGGGGGGATPNLQQVTDVGAETDKVIIAGGFQSIGNTSTPAIVFNDADNVENVKGYLNPNSDVSILDSKIWNLINESGDLVTSTVKTASFTAVNNAKYSTNGTITVTDPTPITNKGFSVNVVSGTTTIDGVGYTAGSSIYRYYNGSAWVNFKFSSEYTESSFGVFINELTGKTTPIDADLLNITDTADSNKQKKLSFTNLKAFLKTYFDTFYTNASAVASQITTALSGYATQSYADAKVQNSLSASTTIAPSATAVNTALNGRIKVLARSGTAGSPVTGTTAETQVLQLFIPANTLTTNDWITVGRLNINKTTAVSTSTLRIKISTSATMPSGTTGRMATYTTSSSIQGVGVMRKFWQDGGNLKGVNDGISYINDAAAATSGTSASRTFDPTVDNYLYVSIQNTSASESIFLESYEITN
ncbi:hypothetical protein [Flavobacterium sp. 25HG05S-40]|uniref:hypothetical protein n=1 Tax=Flavobacterium sp. 25HG05S-40 TaxID=3458682 RepID=UPI004044453A